MSEFELVMAKRDMVTLRAFLEKSVKYTKYWHELNMSLELIETVLDSFDSLDLHDGDLVEDAE